MMKLRISAVLILAALSSIALAEPTIDYDGVTMQSVVRTASKVQRMLHAVKPKRVGVLKVSLSSEVKKILQYNAFHVPTKTMHVQGLPSSLQLGMNHTPVLDQGPHGSCATFAIFAALDAALGQGDYYSPLCSLNFGNYLSHHGFDASGWNGQDFEPLLTRLDDFGLVSKAQQRTQGCAGMTEYPLNDPIDPTNEMTLDAFHAQSEPSVLTAWSTLFDITQWIMKEQPMSLVLEQTKKSLARGNRILVGTLLPLEYGHNMGLVGRHHENNDTWVLTPWLEQAIKLSLLENNWGGHAMVITGYDDDAVAVDDEGHVHTGVFTLRNSWGPEVGDQGNYYMSYDYFSVLVMELTELIKI